MQEQIININDEIVITQFLQMFRNIFMNISIFILCIFLFMNPVLLVNALLFISIFLFVKACFSYVTEDNKLQQPSIETEIKIFDESDLLRDRIRKLKRENTVLRDRLDRTDRKHKKRQNISSSSVPPFTFEPFKINVDFLDVKKDEDEVKVDVKDEVKDEVNDETKVDVKDEVKEVKEFKDEVKDELKEEVKEFKDEIDDNKLSLDLEKIITDAINDMINSHDMFKERDGFAILSPIPSTPANTDDDDDEDN